ncbi:MAG: nucleotide-binding domain-containing protein [Myxococcales bacterium]
MALLARHANEILLEGDVVDDEPELLDEIQLDRALAQSCYGRIALAAVEWTEVALAVQSELVREPSDVLAQMRTREHVVADDAPVVAVLEDDACTRAQALRAWGKFFNHEFSGETAEAEGPQELAKSAGVVPISIAVGVARAEGKPTTPYTSEKIAIAKGKHLKFSLPPDWRTVEGATYHWLVRNTGDEARAANDMGHERENQDAETWRYTKYRGVHTMTCEVRRNGTVIARGTRRVRVATW